MTRIVISGTDSRDLAFRQDAEVIEVSLHGARIRTTTSLRTGMRLRIFVPSRRRSCGATVVWSHGTVTTDIGVQLDGTSNFWGLQFPADQYQQRDSAKHYPPDLDVQPHPCTDGPCPVSVPENGASESLHLPGEGTEVTVTGISLYHAPFQERTLLVRDENADTGATLYLKPLLKTGTKLRVIFADGRTTTARVESTMNHVMGDRWTVRVRLQDSVRLDCG